MQFLAWSSGSTRSERGFDLPTKRQELRELEEQTSDPDLWNDPTHAQRVMRQFSDLRTQIQKWEELRQQASDLRDLLEMTDPEDDMKTELQSEGETLLHDVDRMELQLVLNDPYDIHDALLAVHAGTGGVDAQDWAEMLVRMYLRWASNQGFSTKVLDRTEGEEAGIKSATIEIRGPYAFGYLKSEAGTHRLVRLSPFDAAHRRHTSFALVEVLPDVDDAPEVEIRDEDLRVDTFRASGAGGQHVNKTDSAVRITHLPTGIVVTCQNERSQLQNRETAMKFLRAKLIEQALRAREEEQAKIKGEHIASGWGNRIRSYVLQPYTMVTDHRTEFSTSNAQGVLEGNLNEVIDAYLHQQLGEENDA
jgi:peptide chain release factor 2